VLEIVGCGSYNSIFFCQLFNIIVHEMDRQLKSIKNNNGYLAVAIV